jgi:hypothetical protein
MDHTGCGAAMQDNCGGFAMSGLFRQTLFAVACLALTGLSTTARAAYYDIDVLTTPGVPGTGGDVVGPSTSVDITEAYLTPLYEFPLDGTVNFGTVDIYPFSLHDQYGDFSIIEGAFVATYNGTPGIGEVQLEEDHNILYSCNTGGGALGMRPSTCNDQQEQDADDAPPIIEQLIFPVSAGDTLQLGWTESVDYFPPTPLPDALPLFATGLGLLGLFGWRRKRSQFGGGGWTQ